MSVVNVGVVVAAIDSGSTDASAAPRNRGSSLVPPRRPNMVESLTLLVVIAGVRFACAEWSVVVVRVFHQRMTIAKSWKLIQNMMETTA